MKEADSTLVIDELELVGERPVANCQPVIQKAGFWPVSGATAANCNMDALVMELFHPHLVNVFDLK